MSTFGETRQRIKRAKKHADDFANQMFMIWNTYKDQFPGFATIAEKHAEIGLQMTLACDTLDALLMTL